MWVLRKVRLLLLSTCFFADPYCLQSRKARNDISQIRLKHGKWSCSRGVYHHVFCVLFYRLSLVSLTSWIKVHTLYVYQLISSANANFNLKIKKDSIIRLLRTTQTLFKTSQNVCFLAFMCTIRYDKLVKINEVCESVNTFF